MFNALINNYVIFLSVYGHEILNDRFNYDKVKVKLNYAIKRVRSYIAFYFWIKQ